jgi:hypothetical protein
VIFGALAVATITATVAPVATASNMACELHLFALDLGVGPQPSGNFLVKVLPPSDNPLAFINVMSPLDRMSEISDDQYRISLRLAPNTPIIRHWDVAVDRKVRKSAAPLVSTPLRCHFELVGYSSSGMSADRSRSGKNEVFVNLLFREFSVTGELDFKFDKGGWGKVDREEKVGREAALQSLSAASVAIIDEFGKYVVEKRSRVQ